MTGLEICEKVWESSGLTGYVGLACGGSKGKGQKGSWEEVVFKFPDEKQKIQEWFDQKSQESKNLYWCPVVFSSPSRRKAAALGGTVLYADLDEVNPESLPDEYKPTIAWKSSSKRYQGLWQLDRFAGPLELEELNKRLTYFTGADKSGWDLTQVLRIPGTTNYQYDPPVQGKLLWKNNEEIFSFQSLNEHLPKVASEVDSNSAETLFDILKHYRNKIPQKIRAMLQYPPEKIQVGKRSEVLFKIESALVEAQIPMEDIYLMVKNSSWNKYRGRKDEKERLEKEIALAYSNHLKGEPVNFNDDSEDEVVDAELTHIFEPVSMVDLLGKPEVKQGWMVRDFWLKGSNGIVAGEPKTFKSTITLDLAISVASGEPFLGSYPVEETGPVILVQNENADWIIKDRVERMMVGKHLCGEIHPTDKTYDEEIGPRNYEIEWPPILPIVHLNNQNFDFSDESHREEFERIVQQIKPVLIVFDPLYLMFTGDINSAEELNPVLKWLTEVKNKYKTSVIVVHHFRKGDSHRAGQRMLGSTTLHGWTESSIFLGAHPIQLANVKQDMTVEEIETTTTDMEIVVEREFRAAGVKPKLYLQMSMGTEDIQDYKVTVHAVPYQNYIGGQLEGVEIVEKGSTGKSKKKDTSKPTIVRNISTESSFDKVKDAIYRVMAVDTITEATLSLLKGFDKTITSEDISAFISEYESKWPERSCDYQAIIENGEIVGIEQKILSENKEEFIENKEESMENNIEE